jgi:hypothetical protein
MEARVIVSISKFADTGEKFVFHSASVLNQIASPGHVDFPAKNEGDVSILIVSIASCQKTGGSM